jgi:hypothetical protein
MKGDGMDLKSRVQAFEKDSRILEKIVSNYPEDSIEYQTLKRAAIALWFALTERYAEFKEYVENFDGDLTPEQKQHLRELGIDPDREVKS